MYKSHMEGKTKYSSKVDGERELDRGEGKEENSGDGDQVWGEANRRGLGVKMEICWWHLWN